MSNAEKVKVLSQETIVNSFIKVDKLTVSYDGKESIRYRVETWPSVGILLQRKEDDKILLIKQYRVIIAGTNEHDAWLCEIPAGVADKKNESLRDAAIRECIEETGYRPASINLIYSYYASPGYSTEKMHFFYGTTDESQKIAPGGGLASENEMIIVEPLLPHEAFQMIEDGKIKDAKTILALQWLRVNC